jgi:esterase/lipase
LFELTTIEATLAAQEADVPHLRKGCEKRIVWAGAKATKTAYCVVYLHGFSATGEELRPLPDMIAQGLGANIYFTRLAGHGQDGDAMGRASLQAWQDDVAEAFAVARTIGQEVIVIGCSTGCTLATLAFAEGVAVKAMIHVSPNFGLRHRVVQTLLDLPRSRRWAKYVAGDTRSFTSKSDAHAAFWTLEYPTEAVHVMADAVRAAREADLSKITTPALFCYNPQDQVVHPDNIKHVIAHWGAPTETVVLEQTPADDEMGHIMAGDIFSPNHTAPLAQRILAWFAALT